MKKHVLRVAIASIATTLLIFIGAFAQELPPCGDYMEPEFWFEVPNFFDTIAAFDDLHEYGDTSTLMGVAFVNGSNIFIDCGVWSTSIIWHRTEVPPPVIDGQNIRVYAHVSSWEDYLGYLYIFNMDYGTLLGMGGNIHNMPIDEGAYFQAGDSESLRVCVYDENHERPPQQGSEAWEEVYGKSFTGYYGDSDFNIDWPGKWVTTDDGLYQVFSPIHWDGETEHDYYVKSWFQIMKATNGGDDDTIDDDSADDDTDDDADDDSGDDADDDISGGDSDDDGNGGCFG